MNGDNPYSIWKFATVFLTGVVLSMSITWASYVRTAMDRPAVEEQITQQNAALEQRVSTIEKEYDQINAKLDYLIEKQGGRK